MKSALMLVAVLLSLSAILAHGEDQFVSIMYDEAAEKEIGAFPPSRTIWAQALETLGKLGAKAVVLKFFFDLPKSDFEDKALAVSMKSIPTFLQARIDDSEANPNALDTRFLINIQNAPKNLIRGNSGWLPLPILGKVAQDIGFVDIREAKSVPMLVEYKGNFYKSLWLAVLQYALPGISIDGKSIHYGGKSIALNKYGEVVASLPAKDDLKYIPLTDLLAGTVPRSLVVNKIVVVGYDGEKQDYLDTPIGKLKSHRVFYYWLLGLYRALVEA
jgi:CHASE2 domain-containing sensor protein